MHISLHLCILCLQQLQRNIVRGIEGFIATSSKLLEIGKVLLSHLLHVEPIQNLIHWCFTLTILATKLADDCCKYGAENQNTGSSLARASLHFGKAHKSMEDERETLLGILGEQVIS